MTISTSFPWANENARKFVAMGSRMWDISQQPEVRAAIAEVRETVPAAARSIVKVVRVVNAALTEGVIAER